MVDYQNQYYEYIYGSKKLFIFFFWDKESTIITRGQKTAYITSAPGCKLHLLTKQNKIPD